MAELRPNIVFNCPHFVRHLGICNPICVQGHSEQFKRKTASLSQNVFLTSTNAEYTHTHRQTHTHTQTDTTVAIGEMQCVSFRLKIDKLILIGLVQVLLHFNGLVNPIGKTLQPKN